MRPLFQTWLVAAGLLAAPSTALAASDIFFCITGVSGSCTYSGVTPVTISTLTSDGWLRVDSFSMGLSNVPPASNPHGPGVTTPRPTEVVRSLDSRSAVLVAAALQGQRLQPVKVLWRRSVTNIIAPYQLLVMTNTRVVRLQTSSAGDVNAQETLALDAASYSMSYWHFNTMGTLVGDPVVTTWTGGVP